MFYNPCDGVGSSDSDGGGTCFDGDELTLAELESVPSANERLRMIVERYGEYAMQLQKYYGIPWEMPFAIMVYESQVGTDVSSIPNNNAMENNDFNTMGMTLYLTGEHSWVDDHYDDDGVEPWCGYIRDQYNCFNAYKTISQQLLGYFIYHGRNGGNYDQGMQLLTLDDYEKNLDEALRLIMSSFCVGSCYDDGIRPIIRSGENTEYTALLEVVKEKN